MGVRGREGGPETLLADSMLPPVSFEGRCPLREPSAVRLFTEELMRPFCTRCFFGDPPTWKALEIELLMEPTVDARRLRGGGGSCSVSGLGASRLLSAASGDSFCSSSSCPSSW